MVLRKMSDLASSDLYVAVSWLLIGAIFFAMRSCEYLKTSVNEDSKRTRILRLRNVLFKNKGKVVDHSSKRLLSAEIVIITFEFQKNDKRDQSVHMYATKDKVLNPVRAWGVTVQRILISVPGADMDTKVCSFWDGEKVRDLDGNLVREKLRATVDLIGEVDLGFGKSDAGLHSIRSGGAMAMFLSGVSEIIIQRVGRWKSQAFLEYIREQVEAFTFGVSQKMLEHESFHHLNARESELLSNEAENGNAEQGDGDDGHIPFTVHYSEGVFKDKIDRMHRSLLIEE